jgi:plasmid maintenance system antidote protein VapI
MRLYSRPAAVQSTQDEAAKRTCLSVGYLQGLVEERESVDQKAANALGKLDGTDPKLWLDLQKNYDRWQKSQIPQPR